MSPVTLECLTNELWARRRQTLVLSLKSKGYSSVSLVVPLESDAVAPESDAEPLVVDNEAPVCAKKALMAQGEFYNTICELEPNFTSYKELGWIRIEFDDVDLQYEVELTFRDFMVSVAGTVEISAVDENGQTLTEPKTKVEKLARKPVIRSFKAEPYNLTNGGSAKLSWDIEPVPSDNQHLYLNGSKLESGTREKSLKVVGETDFVLVLKNTQEDTLSEAQLRVHAFGHSHFKSIDLSMTTADKTSPAGIVGCFAGEGYLWVMLRENDTQTTLWKTRNGFDPADRQWLQERQGSQTAQSKPVRIPLQAARRPGVIFKEKLWLLGGDCCHPDKPSNAIGQYHLQGNGQFRDGTAPWPARMGHMVVRVDAERIWVMGGWRQGGGPLNDIWQFDGTTWTKLPAPGWKPRCLFGATATETDVWIAGGFESPGGRTYDDIWRYSKSDKAPKWESIKTVKKSSNNQKPESTEEELVDIALCPKSDWQYSASLMFVLDKTLLIFTSHFDPSDTQPRYRHHIQKIDYERGWHLKSYIEDEVSALGLIDDLDYFRLDGGVFNDAMFLRELTPDPLYVSRKLPYFVKV